MFNVKKVDSFRCQNCGNRIIFDGIRWPQFWQRLVVTCMRCGHQFPIYKVTEYWEVDEEQTIKEKC